MTQAMLILFTPTLELDARELSLAFTHYVLKQSQFFYIHTELDSNHMGFGKWVLKKFVPL